MNQIRIYWIVIVYLNPFLFVHMKKKCTGSVMNKLLEVSRSWEMASWLNSACSPNFKLNIDLSNQGHPWALPVPLGQFRWTCLLKFLHFISDIHTWMIFVILRYTALSYINDYGSIYKSGLFSCKCSYMKCIRWF